jgi:hypothetical protein
MAAIGPISAIQRVTRVRIGTGWAHDVGRVHHSLSGVALQRHLIGKDGTGQAKNGCHCRCSDVRDFAHRSVSFDKIRSSSRSRQWPYNQPSAAGYRIDRLTNGIEAVRDGRVRAAANAPGRHLEKCRAGAQNGPIRRRMPMASSRGTAAQCSLGYRG